MTSPDAIHDAALLTVSAWQRQALPSQDEALLMLWKFQAERAERQDNTSEHDWHRVNDVVGMDMGLRR